MTATKHFTHVDEAVAFVRERLGKHGITAAPLGLGKPNRMLNALYRAAKADPTVHMKLMTALSLARPNPAGDLEKRFLGPFAKRWWGDNYPDLEYLADLRANSVPANIEIREFYLQSGSMLGKPAAHEPNRSSGWVAWGALICSLTHCGFQASCLATQSGCALISDWTQSG